MENKKINVQVFYTDETVKNVIAESFSEISDELNILFSAVTETTNEMELTQKYDLVVLQIPVQQQLFKLFSDLFKTVSKKAAVICISSDAEKQSVKAILNSEGCSYLPLSLVVPKVMGLLIKNYQLAQELKTALHLTSLKNSDNYLTREIFLMGVSHEIRTPLNSIIGFANLLLKNKHDEREMEYLHAIKKSGENIQALIENLVAVSFTEAVHEEGKLSFESTGFKKVNFNAFKKLNILVVEDDFLNLKLIKHLFSDYGIKPDSAENGKIAIDQLQKKEYDLILMDMEMPVMDGYEATDYIRNVLKSRIPIIAMTAHAMPGERERCLQHGMNDYISKPVNVNLLFEKIYKSMPIDEPNNNIVNTKRPVTDFSYLTSTMSGKKEAIREMIVFFLKQLPVYLEEIKTAIDAGNYETIHKLAHKIKSVVAIMGIQKAETHLLKMENLSKDNSSIEDIKMVNHEVTAICHEAFAEVEQELLKYK